MSDLSPKRPNKLTVTVSADGRSIDYLYEVNQSDPMTEERKARLESRRRARQEQREAREREIREREVRERAENPPPRDDKPAA